MIYIIKYEISRIFKKPRNKLLLLVVVFVALTMFIQQQQMFVETKNQYLENFDETMLKVESDIEVYESVLTGDTEDVANMSNQSWLNYNKRFSTVHPNMIMALENSDNDLFRIIEKEQLESLNKYYGDMFEIDNAKIYSVLIANNNKTLEHIDFLEENNIELPFEDETFGWYFIFDFIKDILPLIIPLLLFLLLADLFTKDNDTGFYKFLLINPNSRTQIFYSKIIAGIISGVVFVVIPLLISCVIVSILNGTGSLSFPVLFHEETYSTLSPLVNNLGFDASIPRESAGFGSYTDTLGMYGITPYSSVIEHTGMYTYNEALIPTSLWVVFLAIVPLLVLSVLFIVSVVALVSVITQKGFLTIAICGGISFISVATTAPITNISLLAQLNPFLYFHWINILTGLGSVTALQGVIVLTSASVLLVGVASLIFNKQDIRC